VIDLHLDPERRRLLGIIAEAFELSPREVFVDATVVDVSWRRDADLYPWLQQRHGWHDSVAPYYLAHLRRLTRYDSDNGN
jgi:hypothetical protein